MARGVPPSSKTAPKTVGRPFQPGADPRRGHGLPGRSGRKPEYFYERAKALCDDPMGWDVALAHFRAGDIAPLKLAAEYTYEKPTERQEMTGEVTIKVVFDD